MSLNIFDIFVIFMFLIFMIVGWKNGVIKELVGFLGFLLVFIISFIFKGVLGNILCLYLPFFEFNGYIEGLSTLNIFLYQALAFILLFAALLGIYRIILKISKKLQKLVNYTIVLLLPSKILGALVGFLEAWVVVFAIIVIVMVPFQRADEFKKSTLANKIVFNTPILSNQTASFINSVVEIYGLSSKISMEELEINEANVKSVDVMLKYKIIDKDTVVKLVKTKKLKNIKGIQKVINKY